MTNIKFDVLIETGKQVTFGNTHHYYRRIPSMYSHKKKIAVCFLSITIENTYYEFQNYLFI